MMSQASGYAATALGYVAAAGGKPVLVKDIAESSDLPASYLAKIINALARKGLVITQRGIGGGVVLASPATAISLYDICVALDDPCVQAKCMLGTAQCSDDRACPAHRFWQPHREQYIHYLQTMTLADVASFELRRRSKASKERERTDAARPGVSNLGGGDSLSESGPDLPLGTPPTMGFTPLGFPKQLPRCPND